MATLSPDTPPDIERLQIERLRQMPACWKMDVDLVADLRPEQAAPLARALGDAFAERRPEWRAYVASAHDIVLSKLEWYRLGGEASGRQWRDALGVLKVQGDRLDRGYMRRMAAGLYVQDLLEGAFVEVGEP